MAREELTPEEIAAKINFQADGIPDGDSKFQHFTSVKYVRGATQPFENIAALVAFHPNKLVIGQSANVVEFSGGVPIVTTYILMANPETMFDPETTETFVTLDNFDSYWSKQAETLTNFDRTTEYSPDGPNGSKPPYPYEDNVAFESNWSPVFDAAKGHKWLRFRDDDVDDNDDGIFDNWTVPIAIGNPIGQDDFIVNAYTRQNITPTIAIAEGELVDTDLLVDDSGHYQVIKGNIDVVDGSNVLNLTTGRYFKYEVTKSYTFNNSAEALQLLPPPPRTIGGISNDNGSYTVESGLNSIIFQDDIPAGTDLLHEIVGQKSVYSGLKSNWVIRTIIEDPNLTRFSKGYTDNPNSIVGTDDDASDPSQGNTDLITAGWFGEFILNTVYLATRETTGGSPAYTEWHVQKVAGESGEYKDRVFKLFELNKDVDDVKNEAPVGADAISEGWSDTPLIETDSLVNYVSESIKYFNGELKIPWSIPVPYTGRDTFTDVIISENGFAFKYLPNSNDPTTPDPTSLILEARLIKGIVPIWINLANEITYQWIRVYNNGIIDSTIADDDSGKDFYTLPTSGTPGQDDYIRIAQQLFVNPDAVDGKAVFECTQTFTMPDATVIIFKEQTVITDITDGLDAKDLSVSADSQLIIRDTVGTAFAPADIIISAFQNNLPQPATFFWWLWDGATWNNITSGVTPGYVITPTLAGSRLDIDVEAAGFTIDDQLDEKRYAVTNYSGVPENNDNITEFADFITITKTSSAGIGSAGENSVGAILDNENYNVLLDAATGDPFAGELGIAGKASTLCQLFDGGTLVPTGAGAGAYLVSLVSDNPNITFGQLVEGSNIRIYADTWASNERQANCTITISYETGDARGTIIFNKLFSLNSTLDQVGAILAIVEGIGGRISFTPDDRTDITLQANLYNDARTPTLQDPTNFYYRWGVAGLPSGAFINAQDTQVVTRDDIRSTATVIVQIAEIPVPSIPNDLLRTAEIRITDIVDGKTLRLYSTNAINDKPLPPADTVDDVGDGVIWFPDSTDAIWSVDGNEKPLDDWPDANSPRYRWSNVYQIGSEAGDQGGQGGGYYYMYSSFSSGGTPVFPTPNGNISSIDEMFAGIGSAKWLYALPNTDVVWQVQRLYQGFTPTSDTVILDNAGKLVGGDNSDAIPVTGSTWSEPLLISGIDANSLSDAREVRYQGLNIKPYTGFDENDRDAGIGWDKIRPSVEDFNYIYETVGAIDSLSDALVGVWVEPVLIFDGVFINSLLENYLSKGLAKNKYIEKLKDLDQLTEKDNTPLDGTIITNDIVTNNNRVRLEEIEIILQKIKLIN